MIDTARRESIRARAHELSRVASELRDKVTASYFKMQLTRQVHTFEELERMFLSEPDDPVRTPHAEDAILHGVEVLIGLAAANIQAVQDAVNIHGYTAEVIGG